MELTISATPKPSASALAHCEGFGLSKRSHDHWHKHELGQPLHGFKVERIRAPIPAAHHQRPLIIRVDQPDQIPEHDTVLVTESRARQD